MDMSDVLDGRHLVMRVDEMEEGIQMNGCTIGRETAYFWEGVRWNTELFNENY